MFQRLTRANNERIDHMFYRSTRNSDIKVSSAQAIVQGISKEGGLFVPSEIPKLSQDELAALGKMPYPERAAAVFKKFLTDFTDSEIQHCVGSAYTDKNFDTANITELKKLTDSAYVLELWHGPTCAFKDMALQILPYLLTTSAKKTELDKKIVILVATSGDTGKAALEGFKDVDGTSIIVFYPVDGVSAMQKKQMTTQEGKNVGVCAIKGNFDDAQNGVKKIFTDKNVAEKLASNGMMFSSANSINWGRLAPQIIYYVSSYAQLVANGEINMGDKINIVVPTGNFGNILAAFYAKHMGVPVNKLICASNANNVLTDFLNTGVYDRNRHFYTTISPSMDILISSNLERLLYHLSGEDDSAIKDWFGKLSQCGKYEVSDFVKDALKDEFYAGFCDDTQTKECIKDLFDKYSYTCDTHTAVAVKVYMDYIKETGDTTKTVIASTASPYKFSGSVLDALGAYDDSKDEFALVDILEEKSGLPVPQSIKALKDKDIMFSDVISREELENYVTSLLGV